MSDVEFHFSEFLRTFFDDEIYFLASKSLQHQIWGGAKGDQFGMRLSLSLEAWNTILEHRKKFNLTSYQIDQIQKLFDMLEDFQVSYPFPSEPREYQALLTNPAWVKIQQYADQLYQRVGKTI